MPRRQYLADSCDQDQQAIPYSAAAAAVVERYMAIQASAVLAAVAAGMASVLPAGKPISLSAASDYSSADFPVATAWLY